MSIIVLIIFSAYTICFVGAAWFFLVHFKEFEGNVKARIISRRMIEGRPLRVQWNSYHRAGMMTLIVLATIIPPINAIFAYGLVKTRSKSVFPDL